MHEITGNREAVEKLLKDTVRELESAPSGGAKKTRVSSASARAKPVAKTDSVAGVWREALQRLENRSGEAKGPRAASARRKPGAAPGRAVDTPYAPRDQMLALFQSAMDEYLDKKAPKKTAARRGAAAKKPASKGARAASARKAGGVTGAASLDPFYTGAKAPAAGRARATDIMARFGKLDPGWGKVVVEKAKVLFKGKRPFIAHKSATDFRFAMADKTTVAIVGDWGGGNEAAQAVARQIAKLKPDHVIHLGDVYYSGTPKEVEERFLQYWPSPSAPGMSFALNSNHEMYSGGYGYFDHALKKFKQPASYFSLANANWRFIGLDTGYDEHDLHPPQAAWLAKQLDGGAKTILMSHHQLFSAYESTNASKLRSKVQPMLGRVYGWIWGHEHLAVVYQKHEGINAICLGNGCFPYNFPKSKPAIPVKWLDKRQSTDPDYQGGHTFALLRIDGARIDIDFIDHKGQVGHTETWR